MVQQECALGHEVIFYTTYDRCPLCRLKDVLREQETEIDELILERDSLIEEISDLKNQVKPVL